MKKIVIITIISVLTLGAGAVLFAKKDAIREKVNH